MPLVQAVPSWAPNNASPTHVTTIAPTQPASVLLVRAIFWNPGSSRTVYSNGTGTWTLLYDSLSYDGIPVGYFICLDPGGGTTQITADNNGTNSHFTVDVLEVSNIDTAVAPLIPANHNAQSLVTAWTSSSIALVAPSTFVIGFTAVGANVATSVQGAGFTPVSAAGYSPVGNNINTAEGDVSFVEYGTFGPATLAATGTFSGAVNTYSFVIGLQELAANDGTYHLTSDLYF